MKTTLAESATTQLISYIRVIDIVASSSYAKEIGISCVNSEPSRNVLYYTKEKKKIL